LFFDLSPLKIVVLAVLGLVIFGPDQLPKLAAQAGRALRDLRRMADSARADLTENLGQEFRDFDFNDLNPRAFVRKHLLDELNDGNPDQFGGPADTRVPEPAGMAEPALRPDEVPPYDLEAT
jgi:sec-independent protein translocase protein TatB